MGDKTGIEKRADLVYWLIVTFTTIVLALAIWLYKADAGVEFNNVEMGTREAVNPNPIPTLLNIGAFANTTGFYPSSTKFVYTEFIAVGTGAVSYGHFYHNYINGGYGTNMGLYSSAGTILAYGYIDWQTSPGWNNVALNTSPTLVNGQTYIVGVIVNRDVPGTVYYGAGTGYSVKSISMSFASTLANADFSSPTTLYSNAKICVLFDNNSGTPS
jgi:hypothetical protein